MSDSTLDRINATISRLEEDLNNQTQAQAPPPSQTSVPGHTTAPSVTASVPTQAPAPNADSLSSQTNGAINSLNQQVQMIGDFLVRKEREQRQPRQGDFNSQSMMSPANNPFENLNPMIFETDFLENSDKGHNNLDMNGIAKTGMVMGGLAVLGMYLSKPNYSSF